MYIQANIGRNFTVTATNGPATATKPMDTRVWEAFKAATMDAIMDAIMASLPEGSWPKFLTDADVDEYAAFQVHTGMGEWEGVKEESAHVSVYFDGPHTNSLAADSVRNHLETGLELEAKRYGQDAIAFVVTDSHLATR